MNTQNQLSFLKTRIEELQTAVLRNCSHFVLNIPSAIVKTLHVDETGCIWFSIDRPKQAISEFERRFPVSLNYYQKGRNFFLDVEGMARLVIDPEEIYSLPYQVTDGIETDKVLVCVKILSASYHALKTPVSRSPFISLIEYFKSLIDSPVRYINLQQTGLA